MFVDHLLFSTGINDYAKVIKRLNFSFNLEAFGEKNRTHDVIYFNLIQKLILNNDSSHAHNSQQTKFFLIVSLNFIFIYLFGTVPVAVICPIVQQAHFSESE